MWCAAAWCAAAWCAAAWCAAATPLPLALRLGVVCGDIEHPLPLVDDPGLESRERRNERTQRGLGTVAHGENEFAVGAGGDADVLDAGQTAELTLESGNARHACLLYTSDAA